VYGQAELLLYGGDQVRFGIGGDGPLDKCHDLLRQLVSTARPRFCGTSAPRPPRVNVS